MTALKNWKRKMRSDWEIWDAVIGLGRKATDEELFAYFSEDKDDQNLIPSDQVFLPFK